MGSVASDDQGKLLLCRRAIEPRKGFWTLPAGFLETGESPEAGAKREALEEAGAILELDRLLAIYSVERISQVQLMYRARLTNPDTIAPGMESLELKLVTFEEIPWTELAFPSVNWALRQWYDTRLDQDYAVHTNPVEGI